MYNTAGACCGVRLHVCSTDNHGGHGTHTAGSIVGNGYNSLAQRGLTGYATAADPSFDYAWGIGQAPEANIRVIHAGKPAAGSASHARNRLDDPVHSRARAT